MTAPIAEHWKEWLHPRDWRGRFIEKGDVVALPGGIKGRALSFSPDGVSVMLEDGREGIVPADQLSLVHRGDGAAAFGDTGPGGVHYITATEERNRLEGALLVPGSYEIADRDGYDLLHRTYEIEHNIGSMTIASRLHFPDESIWRNYQNSPGGRPGVVNAAGNFFVGDNSIGGFTRTIFTDPDTGKIVARHESLRVDPDLQGMGLGKAFVDNSEMFYRTHGVDRIELGAAGTPFVRVTEDGTPIKGALDYNGGYTWARAGYTWRFGIDDDSIRRQLYRYAKTDVAAADPVVSEFADRIRSDESYKPTPFEVSELGRPATGTAVRYWPGKRIMMQTSWDGVKKLSPYPSPVSSSSAPDDPVTDSPENQSFWNTQQQIAEDWSAGRDAGDPEAYLVENSEGDFGEDHA